MERELDTTYLIDQYIGSLKTVLDELPQDCIQQLVALLHRTRITGHQVFIMGNGGSASTATHFVADLAKNTRRGDLPGFRVIGLTDNMALFSALANDEGYENVFAQQLRNLLNPNDVVIAISGSGNSPNVLRAIDVAKEFGAITVGLTGMGGGKLGGMVQLEIRVPSYQIQQVEDVHLMLEHMVVSALLNIQPGDNLSYPAAELEFGLFGAPVEVSFSNTRIEEPAAVEAANDQTVPAEIHQMMEKALALTGAKSITLILLDDHGKLSHAVMMRDGQVEGVQSEQINDVVHNGLAGWVIRNRKAALVSNTGRDPRWLRRVWDDHNRPGRSAMSIPLTVSNHLIGTMTLVSQQEHKFTMQDLSRLSQLAATFSTRVPGNGSLPQ